MASDDTDHQSSNSALIKIPDQLQQAKRPDAPPLDVSADQRRQTRETLLQRDGILGQLETEHAHD